MSRVPSRFFDALVVGGGLHGCMVALTLARAGMKTALIERGALCREASGVNAGTLTMQMTRVALIPYALKGHEIWPSARDWLGDVGTVVCDGLSVARRLCGLSDDDRRIQRLIAGRLTKGLSDNQSPVLFARPSQHVHVAACAKGQPVRVGADPESMLAISRLVGEIPPVQAAASPLLGHV